MTSYPTKHHPYHLFCHGLRSFAASRREFEDALQHRRAEPASHKNANAYALTRVLLRRRFRECYNPDLSRSINGTLSNAAQAVDGRSIHYYSALRLLPKHLVDLMLHT